MSRVPATDISGIPDDFLDAIVTVISERDEPDPEAAFARRMEAIFKMREIARRDGDRYTGSSEELFAEYARRHDGERADEAWLAHYRRCDTCRVAHRKIGPARRDAARCERGRELRNMIPASVKMPLATPGELAEREAAAL